MSKDTYDVENYWEECLQVDTIELTISLHSYGKPILKQ